MRGNDSAALAGIAVTLIAMGFIFQLFATPLLGFLPMMLILVGYSSRIRLPFGLPASSQSASTPWASGRGEGRHRSLTVAARIRAFLITRKAGRASRVHMKKQVNAESAVRQRASSSGFQERIMSDVRPGHALRPGPRRQITLAASPGIHLWNQLSASTLAQPTARSRSSATVNSRPGSSWS